MGSLLMTSETIHGPKDGGAAQRQILDIKFLGRFPSTPDEFGPETSSIGSVLKLYFYPYKERPNLTPYTTWAAVLVRPIPGVRNQHEIDLDWASNLLCTPLLVSYDGGHGGGRFWASSNSSSHIWGVLQLGPGSQG